MNAESDSPQVKTEENESVLDSSSGVEAFAEEAAQDIAHEPSVGQRLRMAREAKGMTMVAVAGRLKLSLHQVEDLESDDWNRLKCTTITRGFVRNYARLVDLDAAELMAALDRIAKPQSKELAVPTSINVKVPSEHGVERRDTLRVASGLLVLVVAILVYFFLPVDFMQSTYSAVKARFGGSGSERPAATAEPERKVVESAPEPAVVAPSASTEAAPAAPAVVPSATASAPTSVPASAVPSPAAVTTGQASPAFSSVRASLATGGMKLAFSKPSWVEIKDGSGQVIFSQLSPAGAQREISGQPPFSLIIGNAAGVTLDYKGKPVDLSSRRSKDDVARITLE